MRLLVFGDSLCYFGPREAMPIDDPRLWPNRLPATVDLFAGIGWTMRDAYWALVDNPAVWARLPEVDAVILEIGGMDMLPSPVPTYLRQGIRYLRSERLRRTTRSAYLAAQPRLARLPGCPVSLPPKASTRYASKIVEGLRSLRPGISVLGMLPPLHRSPAHGFSLAGYRPQCAALRSCYAELEVPMVDLRALTARHVLDGQGNADGIHWGWEAHEAVADAVAGHLGLAHDGHRLTG
ncbi:diglucosylglycerate octanoyltransferase [Sciscionella marina]|uniref:diglucosylglycerate octanoyltransferase n=1 Tax=Sciscionella marina TaxID=508770 RepID=UPI00037DE74A